MGSARARPVAIVIASTPSWINSMIVFQFETKVSFQFKPDHLLYNRRRKGLWFVKNKTYMEISSRSVFGEWVGAEDSRRDA